MTQIGQTFTPPVFTYTGWHTGEDCSPEEPGKEWLAIEMDGEEYAVIVLRVNAAIYEDDPGGLILEAHRAAREIQALNIVRALNELVERGDYA